MNWIEWHSITTPTRLWITYLLVWKESLVPNSYLSAQHLCRIRALSDYQDVSKCWHRNNQIPKVVGVNMTRGSDHAAFLDGDGVRKERWVGLIPAVWSFFFEAQRGCFGSGITCKALITWLNQHLTSFFAARICDILHASQSVLIHNEPTLRWSHDITIAAGVTTASISCDQLCIGSLWRHVHICSSQYSRCSNN